MLEDFCINRLKYFDGYRNDPTKSALSNLSPWFHFGKFKCSSSLRHMSGEQIRGGFVFDCFQIYMVIRNGETFAWK